MGVCRQCGNDYDRSFEVVMQGERHTFDSFECAIQALAPICAVCGTRVVGHGVQKDAIIYCCVHCAEKAGAHELRDRA